MSRWTHADGTTEHHVDPHYEGRARSIGDKLVYWTCYVKGCDREVRLDGAKVPITTPVQRGKQPPESEMSAQP